MEGVACHRTAVVSARTSPRLRNGKGNMARLLLAIFLLLGLRAAKTSAQVCGENLDGYDVKALAE